MEKLICFQIDNTREIERLASNMKIRIVHATTAMYDETLDSIISGKSNNSSAPSAFTDHKLPTKANTLPVNSILVFCDLSEKHLNRMLFELKSRKVLIDFKAILTPTNRRWTLRQLHNELEREHASFTQL